MLAQAWKVTCSVRKYYYRYLFYNYIRRVLICLPRNDFQITGLAFVMNPPPQIQWSIILTKILLYHVTLHLEITKKAWMVCPPTRSPPLRACPHCHWQKTAEGFVQNGSWNVSCYYHNHSRSSSSSSSSAEAQQFKVLLLCCVLRIC